MATILQFPTPVKPDQQKEAREAEVRASLKEAIEHHIRAGNIRHDDRSEVLAHLDCSLVSLAALIDAHGWRARTARHRLLADIQASVTALRERDAFAMEGAA